MKTIAIILAGGSGTRFGTKTPKQFIRINGKMVIEHTLDVFEHSPDIDSIIVVSPAEFLCKIGKLKAKYSKMLRVVPGGANRKASCMNAVKVIEDADAKILIHNAVQPCLSVQTIKACVEKLNEYDCLSVGVPSTYTIMRLDEEHTVQEICLRERSYLDLGPECFKLALLRKVFELSERDYGYTNFTAFVKANNLAPVFMVEGNRENIKLTYPEDKFKLSRFLKTTQRM